MLLSLCVCVGGGCVCVCGYDVTNITMPPDDWKSSAKKNWYLCCMLFFYDYLALNHGSNQLKTNSQLAYRFPINNIRDMLRHINH